MSATNVVQRHRTIPMTKKDSLSTNGSRLSLISNNSNASNPKHLNEKEHTGHKRARKAQRSESYKRATQGLSVFEDTCAQNGAREIRLTSRTKEERRKYNTLPIGKESNNNVVDVDTSNHKTHKGKPSPFVVRNSSVKSGTYPSPDTDDDQYSVEPERKKKSAFKRFKERLVLTFRMDDRERKRRQEKDKYSDSLNRKSGRKKSSKSDNHDTEKNKTDKNGTHSNHTHSPGVQERNVTQDSSEKIRKELNIFKSFRDSLRRKSPPEYHRQESKDASKRNSSGAQSTQRQLCTNYATSNNTPGQKPEYNHSSNLSGEGRERQPHASYNKQNSGSGQSNKHNKDNKSRTGQRHDRPSTAVRDRHEGNPQGIETEDAEELLEESVDLTTDIFGAIIDPTSQPVYIRQQSWGRQRPIPRDDSNRSKGADRSNLKLEGLRKYRPRSIDNTPVEASHTSYSRQSSHARGVRTAVADVHIGYVRRVHDLSPEVEVDGPDYADGAVSQEDEIAELSDAFIDADDHKRAVSNVAQCLKIIADRIVEEKRRSVTEDEIVKALREIADEIDREKFQGKVVPAGIPRELLPAMKNIIMAKTYASFVDVIKNETAKTIGWDQVAWYTFLTKSALQITGLGQELGRRVKSRAMRYFSSSVRPFVESRPKGWESIHEDTDIGSELD